MTMKDGAGDSNAPAQEVSPPAGSETGPETASPATHASPHLPGAEPRMAVEGDANGAPSSAAPQPPAAKDRPPPESPPAWRDLGVSEARIRRIVALGWHTPTPVQAACFAPIADGRDVLVESHTGSGKTGAFLLPWVERRLRADAPAAAGVQLLVLTPTRELARQVCDELGRIAPEEQVRAVAIYGGTAMQPQFDALARGVHAVVGTPGRILDHLRRRTLDLSKVDMVVLDEADEMLSMGFLEDIHAILDACNPDRQTTLFSATIPRDIERISKRYMRNVVPVRLRGDSASAAEIDHVYYSVSGTMKTRDLVDVIELEEPTSAIVFCNTREQTSFVAAFLSREGYAAEALSSDLSQPARERVMRRMREGRLRFLVATDVAARGIDISHVSHVINYAFPANPESYVHRTGRTGRAGRAGRAISLVGPHDLAHLYQLRLVYPSIEIAERSLPPPEVVAEQRRQARLDRLTHRFPQRPAPEWTLLARDLIADPRGERIVAVLLERALRTQRGEEPTPAAPEPSEDRIQVEPEPPARRARRRGRRRNERRSDGDGDTSPRGEPYPKVLEDHEAAAVPEPKDVTGPQEGSPTTESEAASGESGPGKRKRKRRRRRRGRKGGEGEHTETVEGRAPSGTSAAFDSPGPRGPGDEGDRGSVEAARRIDAPGIAGDGGTPRDASPVTENAGPAATAAGSDDVPDDGSDTAPPNAAEATDPGSGQRTSRKRSRGRRRRRKASTAPARKQASQDEIIIDIDEQELEVVRSEFGEIDEMDELTLKGRRRAVLDAIQEDVELEDVSEEDEARLASKQAEDEAEADSEVTDEGDAGLDDAGAGTPPEATAAPTGSLQGEGDPTAEGTVGSDAAAKKKRRRRRRRRKKKEPPPEPELLVPPHKDFWEVWALRFSFEQFEDEVWRTKHPQEEPSKSPETAAAAESTENATDAAEPAPSAAGSQGTDSEPPSAEEAVLVRVRLNIGRSQGKKAANIRAFLADRIGLEGRTVRDLTVREAATVFRVPATYHGRLLDELDGTNWDGHVLRITLPDGLPKGVPPAEEDVSPVVGGTTVDRRSGSPTAPGRPGGEAPSKGEDPEGSAVATEGPPAGRSPEGKLAGPDDAIAPPSTGPVEEAPPQG